MAYGEQALERSEIALDREPPFGDSMLSTDERSHTLLAHRPSPAPSGRRSPRARPVANATGGEKHAKARPVPSPR